VIPPSKGTELAKFDGSKRYPRLANVRAELATIGLEAHPAAFDEVGHCGYGLTIVFAVAADSQDQIPEAVICAIIFCRVLFHLVFSVLIDLITLVSKLDAMLGNIRFQQ
jgi:hypothetical protein